MNELEEKSTRRGGERRHKRFEQEWAAMDKYGKAVSVVRGEELARKMDPRADPNQLFGLLDECSEKVRGILGDTPKGKGSNFGEETEVLKKIMACVDWGQFKQSGIVIDTLSRQEAEHLRKRFKEWRCDDKRAKQDKVDVWKALEKKRKQLG